MLFQILLDSICCRHVFPELLNQVPEWKYEHERAPSPGLSRSIQSPLQGPPGFSSHPTSPQTSKLVEQANNPSRSADRTRQDKRDQRPVQTKQASWPLPNFGSVRIRRRVEGRQHRTRPPQGLRTGSLSRPLQVYPVPSPGSSRILESPYLSTNKRTSKTSEHP